MLKELQDIGLSEKEARVYVASLEIGKATADQLAKQAKVVRPTVYVQLESLMQKGLVSKYEDGKKTFFVPESPDYLKRFFELKRREFEVREKELETLLPGLTRMFEGAGERPAVRFFDGKVGVATLRENLLSLPAGTDLRFIYCHDALARVYSEPDRRSHAQKRATKGINLRSVYTRKEGPFAPDDIVPNTERRYISYEKMPITSDMYIYNNTVAIIALQKKIFGVVIESEEIAQTMRIFFELLWGLGEKE